ncbi:MAG TPA: glutamate synthase subunit beta [Nitrospiraceae bacterium]|jgi:glutamate synthase (NADPH/NADH) small chain|nr:glutamate synthase subunit beta [Nitrospiraceae bacterium]
MADPKGFMKYSREGPKRRPVELRILDWKEFYEPIPDEKLQNQGARCMDCGVPFCQSHNGCPVVNLIPEWNDLVHRGRWKDALKTLHTTNNFPEFTGRLCPAPCESACVLGINEDPVSIRVIEWNIIDKGFAEGWVEPILPVAKTGKTIAVIGSGPAGLACAQQLARAGHSVTVYEKADRIGGLLRYGIPDFKMEKWVIDRRLEQMKAEGVEFRPGVHVGVDLEAGRLLHEYDAVCLALGAEQARELPVPGRELKGVHLAMEYLMQQNKRNMGDVLPGEPITAKGKRVVIIGGGDTGSDCLGTVHRQGCVEVHQFELLPEPPPNRAASTPWPLWPMQLRTSHAHEEGCDRQWSVSTTRFTGHNGHVTKLQGQRVQFEKGQFIPMQGSDFEMEADLVLLAMGFTGPVKNGLLDSLGVKYDARGSVAVDQNFMTNVEGLFAGGDVKRGASLIVWAIAEGRKMAAGVERYLRAGKPVTA